MSLSLRAKCNICNDAPATTGRGVTVGAYLERWIAGTLATRVKADRLKPSTADSRGDIARRHITPGLGRLGLAELSVFV